ncbi:tyrosine-type recombinase/integrase [Planctomicrobium sp. SH668]|uniref:tyrosine-type recombinase/integrase n=1 Tax=Planctomicrobium sp. SH668 TaxID=3448126 RepID=UPI003F5C7137
MNWAIDNNYIPEPVKIRVPTAIGRKGRDITREELERVLSTTDKCDFLDDHQREPYKFFLEGLWWSGLRLQESLHLDWQDDTNLCVDLDRARPVFRIQATNDKGGKYRILPMAPEFAQQLALVPETERVGAVFKLPGRRGEGYHLADRVGHIVSMIGKAANVRVSEQAGRVKFASAHDLRRAFGVRWAALVLPPALMELMRHADINTTMKFYVGQNADRTASLVWDAFEKKTNSPRKRAVEKESDSDDVDFGNTVRDTFGNTFGNNAT